MFTTQSKLTGPDGEIIKNYSIEEEHYMNNEAIFYVLINHTKKE